MAEIDKLLIEPIYPATQGHFLFSLAVRCGLVIMLWPMESGWAVKNLLHHSLSLNSNICSLYDNIYINFGSHMLKMVDISEISVSIQLPLYSYISPHLSPSTVL